MTPIKACAVVSLVCSLWNLFGDLCFIDFTLAQMSFEGFGTIANVSSTGNLFDFKQDWPVKVAQAGGWMYPIWAMATVYPLYLGLETVWPCALLAYGLCVVGGNLHSGYAFATILPQMLHHQSGGQHDLPSSTFISLSQKKIMECYVFGYTPGPPAVMVASAWIVYIVIAKETKFPKWFVLCTPIATLTWISVIGYLLMSWPWSFYLIGSFGTWILFVMNAAASWVLWNQKTEIILLQKVGFSFHQIDRIPESIHAVETQGKTSLGAKSPQSTCKTK